MVGRRERQKRDRERRILRAAGYFFGTKGYAQTTMEDVAASADLAVGTLYNYFRSKQELLLAIGQRETQDQLAGGQRILDAPPEDPVDAAARLIEFYASMLEQQGRKLWREFIAVMIAEAGTVGAEATQHDRQLIAQLRSLVEGLQARGAVSAHVNPHHAAIALYGVYFTWLNLFVISEDMTMERLRAGVRRGSAIVMQGLLPGRREAGFALVEDSR